jgi:hypothetical protein
MYNGYNKRKCKAIIHAKLFQVAFSLPAVPYHASS